ncbi:MAG TPA: carbohydrate kinase family protein [Candidatus Dormibacteraeota bacterium]|nr:carbohydrate kinase family protein [Candidatus Dormibacteraeota bacterium]
MGRIAVTGSVAYDTIMVFPGRFGDHILPGKAHVLNVSFLVERLDRRRGGTAANIAYSLALLGERPLLCAAVGDDFDEYGEALTAAGVDVGTAVRCPGMSTAAAFITTDLADNQIAAFHPGAMAGAEVDLTTLDGVDMVVVSPDAPGAMAAHAAQASAMGARLAFAPAQQLPALSDEALVTGLDAAWLVAGNDYEMELIRSRSGRGVDDLASAGVIVAVTLGGDGSVIHTSAGSERVPVAPVDGVVDPTGAGDAYLAGLLRGLRDGLPGGIAGRIGALTAAYVVERSGPQTHAFAPDGFRERYRRAFGEDAPELW